MREDIINIKNEAIAQITDTKDPTDLDNLQISYLGRNGKITQLFKQVKDLDAAEKKEIGNLLNETKKVILNELSRVKKHLSQRIASKREWFDLSIPGEKPVIGNQHALSKTLSEIEDIFTYLGYQIADGPEIETDYYNFEALNFLPDHPARDTQQTFYIDTQSSNLKSDYILRTQTSAMQGRVMEKATPPFRVLVPGTNYRYEQVDASHGFQFHQVEGFVVDENIHLTDLFGTIDFVLKQLFGSRVKIKFATTNFPFVEPGVDTYLKCTICRGAGCSFCKNTGWSEIMPAGMIHPNVLKTAGIDTKKWGGFAFAIGSSRIANLKYQIQDLRILTTPDLKILSQF